MGHSSLNKRFRLTRSIDFKRVRKQGQSFVHPLVVLVKGSGKPESAKIGLSVSRSVGNAVVRNHTKRILREIMRPLLPSLKSGSEFVLVARSAIVDADFKAVGVAVLDLLKRSKLLQDELAKKSAA